MKKLFSSLALTAALGSLLISIQPLLAQGTAFTYQGQLSSNGVPLNGNYDFEFSLYPNAAGTGSPLGTGTATQTAIGVSNGLFTTTLNFGAVFAGNTTWLAIGVRSNNVGNYTALTPLQELTPTPYAIYTPNAGSAANATTASTANSVAAANITGTVSLAQLPAAVVTNTETGVTFGGTFSGNGGGLTNLNVSTLQLTSYGNTNGGQQNFFVGNAGNSTTSGSFNAALGDYALEINSTGSDNTALGDYALGLNTSGSFNTGLGYYALYLNGSGSNNIALGYNAGLNINGGSSNIDIGNPGVSTDANITRIGANQTAAYIAGVITGNGGGLTNLNAAKLAGALPTLSGAGLTNLTASNITAGGTLPVLNGANLTNLNTSQLTSIGSQNTNFAGNAFENFFVGPAGNGSVTGNYNTAIGTDALIVDTSGSGNTAYGTWALEYNTSGLDNTAYGLSALDFNTTGSNNTACGANALLNNTIGNNNTAFGWGALGAFDANNGASGSNNIALGYGAGLSYEAHESGNIDIGNFGTPGENDVIHIGTPGVQTTAYIAGVINGDGGGLTNVSASGSQLTSIGSQNINFEGNAFENFFVGPAGNGSVTGNYNTAMGYSALFEDTSGYGNTAYGTWALEYNTSGLDNAAYGLSALDFNTTGSNNTACGVNALLNNTIGNNNTAFGWGALGAFDANNGASGSNNIALGYGAGLSYEAHESGNIDIGNFGTPGENYVIHIGTSGVQTTAYIAGVINGNGGGLINLNASQLTSGSIQTSVLPGFQSSSSYNAVGGGQGNVIGGEWATIAGGNNNTNNDSTSGAAATIAGGQNNLITSGQQPAIGGGFGNSATGNYATIPGGLDNVANGTAATVSGFKNQALAGGAVVSGGGNNIASGLNSAVGGGSGNETTQQGSVISGGYSNTNTGAYSTIAGGYGNVASANYSLVAGSNSTDNGYNNSFVWGDGSRQSVSQGANTFNVLATGGFWIFSGAYPAGIKLAAGSSAWATLSDRNVKKNFQPVNTKAVLDKLAAIPIQQWNYKWEKDSDVPNIGPMAQDFKGAFYPGRDDKSITTLEFDGVELAAIQGLNQKLEAETKAKDAEIDELKQSVAELKKMVQLLAERK